MLNQLFISNSAYALFLYLLRFWEQRNETLYLLGPSVTDVTVPHVLPIFSPRNPQELPTMRAFVQQQAYLLLNGRYVPCYGNVETVFSPFFVQNFPFYPISDGLWDIKKFTEYLHNSRFKKMYTVKYADEMEQDERIEYLDMDQLWAQRTPVEQTEFAHYYRIDEQLLTRLKQARVLLVTQPMSEDNIMSESDKIAVYKSIMEQYREKIIIKPHPRETTDYRKFFPNIEVFPKTAPVELLKLLVPEIDRVVTFFSTAGVNLGQSVDFYSLDFAKLKWMNANRIENGKKYRPISSFDVEESLKNSEMGAKMNWLKLPDASFYQNEKES